MQGKSDVISLFIGQAGCQMGFASWELFCLEHGIRPNGMQNMNCNIDLSCVRSAPFFEEVDDNRFVPRAVFVDTEPTVLDQVNTGTYRDLFDPRLMLSGKEDAGNCFSRGYLQQTDEFMDEIMDGIRMLIEHCDVFGGFILYRSVGGGTGSGLGSALTTFLTDSYGHKPKMHITIIPANDYTSPIVAPYNALLGMDATMDESGVVFAMDNPGLFRVCEQADLPCRPSYAHANRIVAHTVSAVTASMRMDCEMYSGIGDIVTNLVPYPKIHFPIASIAPIISKKCSDHYTAFSMQEVTLSCFDNDACLASVDVIHSKYLASCLLYRGNITKGETTVALKALKASNKAQFVDWTPTGFKVGICNIPTVNFESSTIFTDSQSLCAMSNSTAIQGPIRQLKKAFSTMLKKKAYIHWYIAEGTEEEDFESVEDSTDSLLMDYQQIFGGLNSETDLTYDSQLF